MTYRVPALVSGPESVADHDPLRATAVLRFPARELSSLGNVPDALLGHHAGTLTEEDVEGQQSFAGVPFARALGLSTRPAQTLLAAIEDILRRSFGASFAPEKLLATVRVDRRQDYRQLQAAHVDWIRTATFHSSTWEAALPAPRPGDLSLDTLALCHSVDCVIGGPPTEFFLDECDGHVDLTRASAEDPWLVESVDFPRQGRRLAGATGVFVHRPPFTVHQFPSPSSWTSDQPLRLFLSCDYWAG